MRLYSPKKNRIVEIDFIRGVLILLMVVDHFFYDFTSFGALKFIFPTLSGSLVNTANWYWGWDVRIVTRFIVLCLFFLISGVSCYFSKNNFKRGLLLSIVGALISIGFYIFSIVTNTDNTVFFGAISCFGLSVLIYALIRFIYDLIFKEHKEFLKYIILIIGIVTLSVCGAYGFFTNKDPSYVDLKWDTFIYIIIGTKRWGTCDWLPLLPYIGFLFIGASLGEFLYQDRISYFFPLPTRIDKNESKIKKIGFYSLYPYKGLKSVICFSGKYSLYFYLLHQPIIILFTSLILMCLGYKIKL